MRLTTTEVDALRATIGQSVFRLFCPPPKIFFAHIEASSYIIWLNSGPDFVSLFSLEVAGHGFRIAAERTATPRDIEYESGVIKNCSDIFQKDRGPSTIRQIGIYEWKNIDSALVFEFDGEGGSFGLFAGDVFDEVCFFWEPDRSRIKGKHALRSVID